MANEIRLRRNNIAGTITDNPLAFTATVINSPGFSSLPFIGATNHAMLILDPLEQTGAGVSEIVKVVSHASNATSVTVLRDQGGTGARSYPFGTQWVHGPLAEDFIISDATSSTRPNAPYEGQLIYETNTNKFVGFGGVDWAPRDAGGTLGYAEKTATDQTGITTVTDLTGLATTVTIGTNRRIKITAFVPIRQITNSGLTGLSVYEGSTQLTISWFPGNVSVSGFMGASAHVVLTPAAGSHTYKLRLETSAVSVQTVYGVDRPAFILVEDIGAA